MNVLSLFDGMSCGQIALNRAGISHGKYYASEVDKHAITVTQANYPGTVQLGDVTRWREWAVDWSSIGLIMGGSPCQGFSFAGKGLAFDDPRSKLFFVFVDILNHVKRVNPDVKFLLENVRMKKEHLSLITRFMGVKPILINSALVSAQNRQRYYWVNWNFGQPRDKSIFWGEVRETAVTDFKIYYSDKAISWIKRHEMRKDKKLKVHSNYEKMQMVEASHHKKYSSQRFFGIDDHPLIYQKPHGTNAGGLRGQNGKTQALTSSKWEHNNFPYEKSENLLRYITPVECERLQTVPDDYTNHVSNTQRYRMLGNGWTVDVVAHILASRGRDDLFESEWS